MKREEDAGSQNRSTTLVLLLKVLLDVVLLIVVISPIVVITARHIQPFTRGFFCTDDSLTYPFKPYDEDAVPPSMLFSMTILLPIAIIILAEVKVLFEEKRKQEHTGSDAILCNNPFGRLTVTSYKYVGVYLFGYACVLSVTMMVKYYLGRLRPYYLTVCKPNMTAVNCTDSGGLPVYIDGDICTGNAADIKEARMSHPSGHASSSMYAAVFIVVYLNLRFTLAFCRLLRPVLQLVALMLGVMCCVSRISDYKHHWSDVLAGGVLGVLAALVTVFVVSDLLSTTISNWQQSIRQDAENPQEYMLLTRAEEARKTGNIQE